jgi:hypothetical protein
MVRLTYTALDSTTTYIEETGGFFPGYTVEQVKAVADKLTPNYQSHDMSSTFYHAYFNFSVRKELVKCKPSQFKPTSTSIPETEPDSPMQSDESGRSESSTETVSW